jgi:arsenate reductase
MNVVIHHNPDCGTSRNVLEIIHKSGEAPTVIEYLKTGWTRPQLLAPLCRYGASRRAPRSGQPSLQPKSLGFLIPR